MVVRIKGEGKKEVSMDIKGQYEEILAVMEMFCIWPCQCQR